MLRLAIYFLVLLVSFDGFSQSKSRDLESKIICWHPRSPEFPGGHNAMVKFINKYLKYPSKAKNDGIEGIVVIEFLVEKKGNLSQFRIIKSLSKECDNEVLRIFKLMPKWKPGDDTGGESYFSCPVIFKL